MLTSYETTGHGQQLCEILSRSNMAVRSYKPGHRIWVYVQGDFDPGDMTLVQGHDTPLCHGQQLCEILSRSNMAVRSYGPDMDFDYVCSDLDFRDMTLIQDYDTLLGHGKHLYKIYRSEKGVRSYGPDTMWTDRQNNRVIPTLIQGQDTHPLAMVNICVDIIQIV